MTRLKQKYGLLRKLLGRHNPNGLTRQTIKRN